MAWTLIRKASPHIKISSHRCYIMSPDYVRIHSGQTHKKGYMEVKTTNRGQSTSKWGRPQTQKQRLNITYSPEKTG
uniref:Uncharacterized protein n=1 Tax=Arion vulgaris TaxID=1028688 RepID=A0A0B7AI44_9EUPU